MPAGTRLAVVTSHPIQYYTPFYRALVSDGGLDVHVLFASRIGLDNAMDVGMGVAFSWRTDLLSGYSHEFLPEATKNKSQNFWKFDNPSVAAVLRAFRPQAVVIHGYNSKTMLRALFWCNRHKVPAIMISDSSLVSAATRTVRIVKKIYMPLLLRRFSAFLSMGDRNQAYLEHFAVPKSRIFRTPNMVDEAFWDLRETRLEERASCRQALGLSPHDLAVIYVGKLLPKKRPADLLKALSTLAEMPPCKKKIQVIFVGDGRLRSQLEAQASAQGLPARFLGFVNIDKLPHIYCAADVLAHPAEIEPFGLITLEAAVLGLPLVLSDRVGAIGETSIAQPGRNTLVYRCGDTIGLAQTIWRLANEPDTLQRLGQASLDVSRELDRKRSVGGALAAVDYCLGLELQR